MIRASDEILDIISILDKEIESTLQVFLEKYCGMKLNGFCFQQHEVVATR